MIAKQKHDRFGASSERGRKLLDQIELQLEELETMASEAAAKAPAPEETTVRPFTRRKPVLASLREQLPRERLAVPGADRLPLLWRQARQTRRKRTKNWK